MLQYLADNVNRTMKHALEVEEKVPLEEVTDFNEARNRIQYRRRREGGGGKEGGGVTLNVEEGKCVKEMN